MDHVTIKAEGMAPAIAATHTTHEMGPCVYLPRFNGRAGGEQGAERGFGIRVYQSPGPGSASYFTAVADAEMLPRPENRVTLSSRRDAWGLPTLHIACSHDAAELDVAKMQVEALRELSEIADAKLHGYLDTLPVPGSSIHECGTARMGPTQANPSTRSTSAGMRRDCSSPMARPSPRSDCKTRRSPSWR